MKYYRYLLFFVFVFTISLSHAQTYTYTIAPEKGDCYGMRPMKCMQVKKEKATEWSNFYSAIEGFDYEPGYTYVIRVKEKKIKNPPADGSSIRYILKKVISKTPAVASKVTSEVLLDTTTSWDGTLLPAYPQGQPRVTILQITVPPHTQLAPHYHPIINCAVILSGSLKVVKDDGKALIINEGEAISELVGSIHYGVNEGEVPVRLIVFYAGTETSPLSVKE